MTFRERILQLMGTPIECVEWVYTIGSEDGGDGEVLYLVYVTLQVRFYEGAYISIDADTYCTNPSQPISSMCSYLEVGNSDFSQLPARVDSDAVFSVMYDYMLKHGDELMKPEEDVVYFEGNTKEQGDG